MLVKPPAPESVPALRHVAVDARVGRGGDAAELSQFGNNVVRIHQYPPAADPVFSTHCRNDQRRHLGRIL
jgi:hypothetical protein